MIQIHLRAKVKSILNTDLVVYLVTLPCFISNLLLEMSHFVKLSTL